MLRTVSLSRAQAPAPRQQLAATRLGLRSLRRAPRASAAADAADEVDVVVIGGGLGGLSAGALLARYGLTVKVCEAHTIPGGAAHEFVRDGYHFESGPSLYSGTTARPRYVPLASLPKILLRGASKTETGVSLQR